MIIPAMTIPCVVLGLLAASASVRAADGQPTKEDGRPRSALAAADTGKLVVLAVRSSARSPSLNAIEHAVEKGLRAEPLRLSVDHTLVECDQPTCWMAAGQKHAAAALLRASVEAMPKAPRAKAASYLVRLDLFDGHDGEAAIDAMASTCNDCQPEDLEDFIYYATVEYRRKLMAFLEGQEGAASASVPEPPPVSPPAAVTNDPSPVGTVVSPPAQGDRSRAAWPWVLVGTGTGLLVTGVALAVWVDGECDLMSPDGGCRRRFESSLEAWGLGLAGAGLLAWGAWALVDVGGQDTKVGVFPGGLRVSGRF